MTQSYLPWHGAYLPWWHLIAETQQLGGPKRFTRIKTWIYNCDYLLYVNLCQALKSQFRKHFVYYLMLVLAFQIKWPCYVWGKFMMAIDLSLPNSFVRCITPDKRSFVWSEWRNCVPGAMIYNRACASSSCSVDIWRRGLFSLCTAVYSTTFKLPPYINIFTCRASFLCFRSTLPHWL